jgi:hypothetical protein
MQYFVNKKLNFCLAEYLGESLSISGQPIDRLAKLEFCVYNIIIFN